MELPVLSHLVQPVEWEGPSGHKILRVRVGHANHKSYLKFVGKRCCVTQTTNIASLTHGAYTWFALANQSVADAAELIALGMGVVTYFIGPCHGHLITSCDSEFMRPTWVVSLIRDPSSSIHSVGTLLYAHLHITNRNHTQTQTEIVRT